MKPDLGPEEKKQSISVNLAHQRRGLKNVGRWFLILFFLLLSEKSLYAQDSRLDLNQVANPKILQLANSTVALVHNENIEGVDDQFLRLISRNFGEKFNLCSSERFREQRSVAFCSGSLIAPDIILTAGHCVATQEECQRLSVIFGFDSGQDIKASEVYQCAELVHSEDNELGSDFALIRLNKSVSNHISLKYRSSGAVALGDALLVIGHPSGLPTKVSEGLVTDAEPENYFVTNLDTYQGSSGSAVFNLKTGMIEGIFFRGGEDFIPQNSCMVSNPCLGSSCGGEDVTKVSEILPYVDTTQEVTFSEVPAEDAGVLHKPEAPCAHSLSNLKALCSF